MRTYLCLGILLLFLTSCDDGDIIFTSFDFDDQDLKVCGDAENKVFYKIKNDNIFESISLSTDQLATIEEGFISTEIGEITFSLSGENNKLVYRTFDDAVTTDYFCNNIPPSTPRVQQEYKSVGGTVIIITQETASDDIDGDDILNTLEGMATEQDTDGDGIFDYLDIDDDGDNVPTSEELKKLATDPVNADGYKDSDEDGIADYLDDDDDNDGVITRWEVTELNTNPATNYNPTTDQPYYLDKTASIQYEGAESLINTIKKSFSSLIRIQDLKLKNQGGDAEEISFESYTLGTFVSNNLEVTYPLEEEEPTEGEETN
ncbi:hypothetical protein L1I30_14040 [Gillisia sp. M10.2A]|uniref:Uncharacterized protein n=1 Tax=Gillisia lutea TaxID=2909668 RepID=A0ABS9ELW0_9FLAO|nr:hypothetical protein [Gillisia lutea]MCF4102795.1 hypothetical protein [Gillisia lutea]